MPYINHDGTVGGRKSFIRLITDFLQGIIDFIALFFGAITNPPQRIENRGTVSLVRAAEFVINANLLTLTIFDSMDKETMGGHIRVVEVNRVAAATFVESNIWVMLKHEWAGEGGNATLAIC